MTQGTIKKIFFNKGFGFITGEDGTDLFFHSSACKDFNSLKEGDVVKYEVGEGPKGKNATNVEKA